MDAIKQAFFEYVTQLQKDFFAALKDLDPNLVLKKEDWSRDDSGNDGGGGKVLFIKGDTFESAAINVARVYGRPSGFMRDTFALEEDEFWASGISTIVHPKNPRVPSMHANFRMFTMPGKYWFGGGADLTPFYPYPEDFKLFHQTWRDVIGDFRIYHQMKTVCDEYFVNHHRDGEMRGIGGIFFDHYFTDDIRCDLETVKTISSGLIPSYLPIVAKRKNEPFSAADKEFQEFRHGRYVEFNLLHDKGTLFGLKSNGNVHSILSSLPPVCRFDYRYEPEMGTPYADMMTYYRPQAYVEV